MERAIKDLCQRAEPDFLEEVSAGIHLIIESVNELCSASQKLRKTRSHRSGRILQNLAKEEADKVLILVDSVRCPREKREERSRTLGYFYNHLAKGIYVEICNWKPANFAEVADGVQPMRRQYYLDGPTGIDWIFPNRIVQKREDDLYVGYVRNDSEDGGSGECYWKTQNVADSIDETLPFLHRHTPQAIGLVRALHETNATKPEGLAIVADVWRSIDIRPDMRFTELEELNHCTLKMMKERGVLGEASDDACTTVRRLWTFPLWPLDLRECKVKKEELLEIQRQWSPECH